jgi:hypothetical protein
MKPPALLGDLGTPSVTAADLSPVSPRATTALSAGDQASVVLAPSGRRHGGTIDATAIGDIEKHSGSARPGFSTSPETEESSG